MNGWIAEKIGDIVEDKVKSALGIDDDEEEEDKKEGFFSRIFDRDDDDDKKKKQKEKDDDKEGFFSRIFNRDDDDDDKGKVKRSGFDGLFSEQQGACAAAGFDRGGEAGGVTGQSDNQMLDDLMTVAAETSGGN